MVWPKTNSYDLNVHDWEFGVGTGFEFDLSKQTSVEVSVDRYNDKWLYTAGFRYRF